MKKWNSEIFQNNNIKLMRSHIGMAAFYCLVYALLVYWEGASRLALLGFGLTISIPLLLHVILAYGSYRRIEISRKVSEIVFAILLLAFPIGTILSMFFFLPATIWKAPEDDGR